MGKTLTEYLQRRHETIIQCRKGFKSEEDYYRGFQAAIEEFMEAIDDFQEGSKSSPVGEGLDGYKVSPMIEQWKCEVCGVWDGCALRQLKGSPAPILCVRQLHYLPKWENRTPVQGHKPADSDVPKKESEAKE